MNKKNIEDAAVVTDQHTLIKREVESHMKPFMGAYFEGEERIARKLRENTKLLKRINGTKTRGEIFNDLVNKAAILLLFILVLNQCTVTDARKKDNHEKAHQQIEVVDYHDSTK